MPSLSLKDYQENRQERGIYDKRNVLNDLTGKEWLFSTKTIIPKKYPLIWPSNIRSRNYNPIPSDLSKELIETFSKPGNTILDPFAGIGSTLIGSFFANESRTTPRRKCIGIENNQSLIQRYYQLIKKLNISEQEMLSGDPVLVLSKVKNESIDFILTDIPIWDISGPKDTEKIGIRLNDYKGSPKESIRHWCSSVCHVLSETTRKLKESKYIVVSIPNGFNKGKSKKQGFPPVNFSFSAILAYNLQEMGLVLKAERIWFAPDSSSEITYKKLLRRFLVFRKESSYNGINHNPLFFKHDIPVGDTYIIHKSFPPSFNHKLRSEHGGMKPPELTQILIEKYSKSREGVILDPFAGVGGTLMGASLSGRKAVGIDINERWKTIYLTVSQDNGLIPQEFLIGDSRQVVKTAIEDNSIALILTDVPYWAMDKLQKTRGRFSKAGEESRDRLPSPLHSFNQASILTIEEWIELLKTVFSQCYPKVIAGKYLVVFIGNMYRTIKEVSNGVARRVGKYLFLSSMLTKVLLDIGYSFETEVIWYAPDKALHVFGYPFSYIPSVVHQSILVFKK
ncbi:MAG: DNA methyltransferase [Promethearchaeota archaeon]